MLLKVDRLPNAVGKQPSIPLIYLGRKWMLNWWWWWCPLPVETFWNNYNGTGHNRPSFIENTLCQSLHTTIYLEITSIISKERGDTSIWLGCEMIFWFYLKHSNQNHAKIIWNQKSLPIKEWFQNDKITKVIICNSWFQIERFQITEISPNTDSGIWNITLRSTAVEHKLSNCGRHRRLHFDINVALNINLILALNTTTVNESSRGQQFRLSFHRYCL